MLADVDRADDAGELIEPFKSEVRDGLLLEWFRVDVPSDLYDTYRERADYAIFAAREAASTYRSPCDWQTLYEEASGETFVVLRESNA